MRPSLWSCVQIGLFLVILAAASGCGGAAATPLPSSASNSTNSTSPAADSRAGWPSTFTVGFFGADDAEAVLEKNEPWRAYFEKKLGVNVKMFTGTSYTAVIEAMRAKRIDSMQVGAFSYILAVQEAEAEALAASVSAANAKDPKYDPKLPPYYYSVVITKKGSGIKTINDLKGKSFSFVDPASGSGHLMPKTLLIKRGLNPDKDMNTIFAGSHPTSVAAVSNGKVPAGATYEGNLTKMVQEGQVDACMYPDGEISKRRTEKEISDLYDSCPDGKIAIIAQSDPIPNTPFAVRNDLPASLKAAVKAALLDATDNPDLIKTGRWYVDPSNELGLSALDQFYNPLRDVAKLLDLDLKELANQGG